MQEKNHVKIESLTGSDIEKLVFEFEDRLAELEVQIEELRSSKDAAENDLRKYPIVENS